MPAYHSNESTTRHVPEPVPEALLTSAPLAVDVKLASAIIFETVIGIFRRSETLFRQTTSPVSAASAVGAGRGVVAALLGKEQGDDGFRGKFPQCQS